MYKDISPLREAEHKALRGITLEGRVLDLGGDKRSEYLKLFQGKFDITTVNISKESGADIVHDLEVAPLPIASESYDGAILVNVLEHIYHAKELVRETFRVVKPGGDIVVVVPFLFPVHPSPHDYWRFTGETLEKMLAEIGFNQVKVEALGSGVFSASDMLWQRLMPKPLRIMYGLVSYPLSRYMDALFASLAKCLGKKYKIEEYPLGYVVTAKKQK